MENHTLTQLTRLIPDLKIHIHGILYIITFIVMKNNILDVSYSMLLAPPWLRDAKVMHDWGNNLISIKDNGIVRTIIITKHLDSNTKCLKVLFCYDFVNGVIDKKEDILMVAKLDLFAIGTIILPKLEILVVVVVDLQKSVSRN